MAIGGDIVDVTTNGHVRPNVAEESLREKIDSVRAETSSYVCSVRDQGPGISAEDQLRLFQRGVRLSAVPTGDESSHGYGLAVAMELLGLIGGEMWCESELGVGSTFSFRLPAFVDEVPSSETAARKTPTSDAASA